MKILNKLLIITLIFLLMLFPIISLAVTENEKNGIMLIDDSEEMPLEDEKTLDEDENSEEIDETDEDINLDAKDVIGMALDDASEKRGDLYLIDNDVTINDVIDGNAYIIANSVTINSQIIGNAFIMAKTINISKDAYIYNSLYALSNNLNIEGTVYDVYSCSDNFKISDGFIHRDLHVAASTVEILGNVQGSAYLSCNKLNLGNGEDNGGSIEGNLEYFSSQQFSIPENAVLGQVTFTLAPTKTDNTVSIGSYILSLINFLCFVILIWLVCLWLAPKFIQNVPELLKSKKGNIALYGFLGLLVLPIISVILLFTTVTSSAALIILAIYILLLCLAKSIFAISINSLICEKYKINKTLAKFGILLVTCAVIWLICLIPYVGSLLSILMSIIGLGILFTYIIPERKKVTE